MRGEDRFLRHPARTAAIVGMIAAVPGPLCWTVMRLGNCGVASWVDGLYLFLAAVVMPAFVGAGITLLLSWFMRLVAKRAAGSKWTAQSDARAARAGAYLGAVPVFLLAGFLTIGIAMGDCLMA